VTSESLELAERALALADGDAAEAVVMAERSGFARYAAGEVHQPTLIDDTVVQLRVIRGGRSGSASTNRIDDEGLANLAGRAAAAAASADPDPELAPLAPPAELPEVEGNDEATAALGADDQARLAEAAIAASDGFGLYGFFTSGVSGDDQGLRRMARDFDGARPHLKLIADALGRSDPLDPEVVEAYWVGAAALDRVGPATVDPQVEQMLRGRCGPMFDTVSSALRAGAVPHHSFTVSRQRAGFR